MADSFTSFGKSYLFSTEKNGNPMGQFFFVFHEILSLLFCGFVLWSVIALCSRSSAIAKLDRLAPGLMIITGGTFLMQFILSLADPTITSRITGPYWFPYLISMVVLGLGPQLFWIPYLRQSVVFRVIFMLLVTLVSNMERFVILVTSIHRDGTLNGGLFSTEVVSNLTVYGLLSIGLFSGLLAVMNGFSAGMKNRF